MSIVLAREEKYNDNNGAFSLAYLWDGKKVSIKNYANGYDGLYHDHYKVNATDEQKKSAVEWYINTAQNISGDITGCVVILKRSRKAENKKELTVLDWMPSGYDGDYWKDEQIKVIGKNNDEVWVSANCIDKYVKGLPPKWL